MTIKQHRQHNKPFATILNIENLPKINLDPDEDNTVEEIFSPRSFEQISDTSSLNIVSGESLASNTLADQARPSRPAMGPLRPLD